MIWTRRAPCSLFLHFLSLHDLLKATYSYSFRSRPFPKVKLTRQTYLRLGNAYPQKWRYSVSMHSADISEETTLTSGPYESLAHTELILAELATAPSVFALDHDAVTAIHQAASADNAVAQHILGDLCHRAGYPKIGDLWFQLASIQNYQPAILRLSNIEMPLACCTAK